MSTLKIFKEVTLPGDLQSNSIYFVAPAGRPDYVEIYITSSDASKVKRVLNQDDVETLISTAIAGIGPSGVNNLHVVDTITERDALNPTENIIVLVTDATADTTVTAGGATYVYDVAKTTWKKIGETESMDLILSWNNINGRPTSAVADIDDAVTKRHTHANKALLDKVGEDENGDFTYGGVHPKIHLDSENW